MKQFSQRLGLTPIKVNIQLDGADMELRNGLWNITYMLYLSDVDDFIEDTHPTIKNFLEHIWMNYFHRPIDDIGLYTNKVIEMVKKEFFQCHWTNLYNILEFIPNNYIEDGEIDNPINSTFYQVCNGVLENHLSPYRFLKTLLVEITAEQEVSSITDALAVTTAITPVQIHLVRALELYSDRKFPDYRNSIKESISAVEAYCKVITNDEKATLGKALAIAEKKFEIHGSLKTAFAALYGYTSDSAGIRHSLLAESGLSQEDAKFMLVSCTAFINYLVVKSARN